MKQKVFLMIALLCAVVQGAWADGGWELVYRQTKTTSANWTALNAGSSTGYTIGTAGTTTYYYATGNLSFTNSTVGGSGLTILGTVYLYIPSGKTVRCTGAKANDAGITGGGAGVELAAGNTLYLLGDGRLEATGGDGESGYRGDHGEDANFEYNKYCQPGSGGRGGDGGGGGGAGIGTRGGNGGAGGAGGSAKRDENEGTNKGVAGSPGSNGDTAGSMGTLYVYQGWNLSVIVKGGDAGWSTTAKSRRGKNAAEDPGNQYAASGGGGGGTSGNGGRGADIGTGGGGGGGGGGGAAGNSTWRNNASNGFYRVGAGGGKGGGNDDGSSYAWDGGISELSNPYDAELNNGLVGTYKDSGWEEDNGAAAGGSGGTCGAASKWSKAVTINVVLDDIFNGKGTESAPYIIGSIADWDVFALLVSNGISFNGLFVKLPQDLSVETMAGRNETNSFQGTFDGCGQTLNFTKGSAQGAFNEEYCAPFRYVKNATIQNLKVAGDIYTAQKYAAGLVARSYGETTFTDCHVTTAIHSSVSGDGTHGGFVALPEGNISFTGCVYTGRLLTNNGTINCGGFVAWNNSKTFNFTHSLYAPDTTAPADGETTITAGCATFVRGGSPANGSTCYYTETMGTEQGSMVIVLASAPSNFGSMVQDYGTVKVYDNGLLVAGRYYVACDIAGRGTEGAPFIIGSTGDWNTLASYVGYGHTFSGQFVKLGGDISVETMVGTGDTNSFQGTFDGGSHTLTFTKGTAQNVFDEDHCAPFRHVKNAVIKNLHVVGAIYTGRQKAGGIVAESHGGLTITNCRSSVNINSSISGDSKDGTHGGLVSTLSGENNTIIIEGCVFDGSFATTNGTNNCGGFIGWGGYNKPTIKNSLMKPGSVAAGMLNSTFARWYTGNEGIYEPTIDNCYYVSTDNLPTDQGTKAVYSARWSTGNLVQDYGMLKVYEHGILYGDIYYADADKASDGAGSGTEGDPYIIGSANEWNAFANYVSNGGSDFKGQFVKLTADISVSEMVGTSNHRFQGTFLGDGVHTLTFTKGSAQSAFGEQYCAPFRYTDGATIQNLKVEGEIYTAQKFAAGLVARNYGTTTITNCRVSTVIHSSVGSDGTHGGFIALPEGNVNFSNCVYDGRMFTSSGTDQCGGFIGWHNSKTFNITNSLYAPNPNIAPADNEVAIATSCATFVRGGSPAEGSTCYYTEAMGTAQGTQVYATIPENEICKVATICNTAVYIMPVCTVSGIEESYRLNNDVEITPVVKYNETSLAFGTDYTATLDGTAVESFPVSPNKMGTYTLILNGAGDYAGSKSFYIMLMPSSTDAVTLTDAGTYSFKADVNVASATYTKSLGESRVGKYQAWFVPFDYTITDDDLVKFDFYKINMIANAPNAQTDATDDIWVFLKKVDAGTVLHANMPYVYKPKVAVTDYAFTTENATLKAKATDARLTMMTAEDTYTLYGTYEPTTATAADPFYYVNINGTLSYGDAVTVGAFRWIMRVESKFGNKPAYARQMVFFDGEEATGIISVHGSWFTVNGSDVWYTLDGRKLDGKPTARGLYINNGKKIVIK